MLFKYPAPSFSQSGKRNGGPEHHPSSSMDVCQKMSPLTLFGSSNSSQQGKQKKDEKCLVREATPLLNCGLWEVAVGTGCTRAGVPNLFVPLYPLDILKYFHVPVIKNPNLINYSNLIL